MFLQDPQRLPVAAAAPAGRRGAVPVALLLLITALLAAVGMAMLLLSRQREALRLAERARQEAEAARAAALPPALRGSGEPTPAAVLDLVSDLLLRANPRAQISSWGRPFPELEPALAGTFPALVEEALRRAPELPAEDAASREYALEALGVACLDLGMLDAAETVLVEALRLCREQLPGEQLAELRAATRLANVYLVQADAEEAAEQFPAWSAAYLRAPPEAGTGRSEVEVWVDANRVRGDIDLQRGRLRPAEERYRSTLEVARKVLGDDVWLTRLLQVDLGGVLTELGGTAQAEELLDAGLASFRHAGLADHAESVRAAANLGRLYLRKGRFAEAEATYAATLEQRRRLFGERHPETLNSLVGLAVTFSHTQRVPAAERLLRRAVRSLEATVGTLHPDHASAVLLFAGLELREGQRSEAEQRLEAFVAERERYGVEDTFLAAAKERLAAVQQLPEAGDAASCAARLEQLLEDARASGDGGDAELVVLLLDLAEAEERASREEAAATHAAEAGERAREGLGEADPLTPLALQVQARLEARCGQLEEAAALDAEGWTLARDLLGEEAELTGSLLEDRVQLAVQRGDGDGARGLLEELLRVTGEDSLRFEARLRLRDSLP